jgi:hypothetical protein
MWISPSAAPYQSFGNVLQKKTPCRLSLPSYEHLLSLHRCKFSDQVWSPENNAHMCAIIRAADIYVLVVFCYGGCVWDALGRADLLFSVDQACAQSASHRLVTVLAVT